MSAVAVPYGASEKLSYVKYPVCRVRCMVCHRESDYSHIFEQEGWSNRFGWATCAECAVVIDPDHPEQPPVVPFPLPPTAADGSSVGRPDRVP